MSFRPSLLATPSWSPTVPPTASPQAGQAQLANPTTTRPDPMSISSLVTGNVPETPPSSLELSPEEAAQGLPCGFTTALIDESASSPTDASASIPINASASTSINESASTYISEPASTPINAQTSIPTEVFAAAEQLFSMASKSYGPVTAVNRKGKGKEPELYDLSDRTEGDTRSSLCSHHSDFDFGQDDDEDDGTARLVYFPISCRHGTFFQDSALEGNAIFELLSTPERLLNFKRRLRSEEAGEASCRVCKAARSLRYGTRPEREDAVELADDDDDGDDSTISEEEHQTLSRAELTWSFIPIQLPLYLPESSIRLEKRVLRQPDYTAGALRPCVDASRRPFLASDHVELTEGITSSSFSSSSLPSPPPPRPAQTQAATPCQNKHAAKVPSPLMQVQNASSFEQQPTGPVSRQRQPPLVTRPWGPSENSTRIRLMLDHMNISAAKLARERGKERKAIPSAPPTTPPTPSNPPSTLRNRYTPYPSPSPVNDPSLILIIKYRKRNADDDGAARTEKEEGGKSPHAHASAFVIPWRSSKFSKGRMGNRVVPGAVEREVMREVLGFVEEGERLRERFVEEEEREREREMERLRKMERKREKEMEREKEKEKGEKEKKQAQEAPRITTRSGRVVKRTRLD